MNVAVFSTKPYDQKYLTRANTQHGFGLEFFESRLHARTAPLAEGYDAVCVFVNDVLDEEVLRCLNGGGTRFVLLRCAGFNNVNLAAAQELGMKVVRVPAYSPHAVAEHTAALLLMLCRKTHRAHGRVREGNFSLDGLMGYDLHGKTAGVVGTGKIGACVCSVLQGFGCKVLGYDLYPNQSLIDSGVEYVELKQLLSSSDIISLHCPLTPQSHHMINEMTIPTMRDGVILINTSRGALIDTGSIVRGLKGGKIGALGLDVYEEEADLFFEDLSSQVIQDDVFARLLTFPNVVITGHQAFFTDNAMTQISSVTLQNLADLSDSGSCANEVVSKK